VLDCQRQTDARCRCRLQEPPRQTVPCLLPVRRTSPTIPENGLGTHATSCREDLVLMAERCGFATGVSLEGLLVAIEFAEACLGGALGGRSSAWLRSQRNRS
jgi:hypothetical protein